MSLNIISLPVGLDACSCYRVRKPLSGIERFTDHHTHIIDVSKDDSEELVKVFPLVDVVLMRPGAELGMKKIKDIFLNKIKVPLKAKWVMDIDDNLDAISPLSQFYQSYGLVEANYLNKPLWRDGKNGFSIQNNLVRKTYLQWGLINADLVTVTTERLAEYIKKNYNSNVFVFDNTIDFDEWWRLNNKLNKPLKIVWQGSPSHYEDWFEIKEPLNKILREFKVELYMLGSNYLGIFDQDNRSKVKTLPWVSFDAHSYRMMSLQPDIAIVPLAKNKFNQYKSSIKWYEMSAMGVPSIVADVEPYSLSIKHKKTAIAYHNPQEFYEGLKLLIENKGLRKNIANNAYQWVFKNKDLKDESIKLSKRLEMLCQI